MIEEEILVQSVENDRDNLSDIYVYKEIKDLCVVVQFFIEIFNFDINILG